MTLDAPDAEDLKNIKQLPAAEQKLALAQRVCPITGAALGSMGVPVKITLRGQTVFLCCQGCVGKAKRNAEETLKKVAESVRASGEPSPKPAATPAADAGRKP